MNILFISYDEVSLCRGNVRTVAMLYALADAGHNVDLLTSHFDLPDHPYIRVLVERRDRRPRRTALRVAALKAAGQGGYDAVHAVDEAVFIAARISGWRKIPLVYDASRCYRIQEGMGVSGLARLFPTHYQRMENRILEKETTVLSPCSALSTDLAGGSRNARIVKLEDVPAQPLHTRRHAEKPNPPGSGGRAPGYQVVCSALPGRSVDLRTLFMAVRKVVEVEPGVRFLFKGIQRGQAEKMAANLDIKDHCRFLTCDEPDSFLIAIDTSDAILMLPGKGGRYIDQQVYTLLHAPAPLVTVHDKAYDEVLTEKTSVRVLPNTDSIAAGLLRTIQEPLLSLAVALEGQQLVADHHTYSSFKHKVRMAYHDIQFAG